MQSPSIPIDMRSSALIALFIVLTAPVAAQDVEMLGERHGTRPPQAYFDRIQSDPGAFQFARGRSVRLQAEYRAGALDPGAAGILGPRNGPVTGTYRVPVVMGLFADSPIPDSMRYDGGDAQAAYFSSAAGTITDFYDQVSGGRVELVGDVVDWSRAATTQAQATGGESGLVSGTTGTFISQLLLVVDASVDWGLYDNDGPDGVPNSGDDDGFVDVLAVLQPTPGGECGGSSSDDRIWSHRWSLGAAAGSTFVTSTASNGSGGGFIKIDDYTVQPIFDCNGSDLSPIGVFAHELGHAFGLPDLYDTQAGIDGKHAGAGNWDLMSSGSYGCDGQSPESPCHMGAWSKEVLGWANIVTLAGDTDHGVITIPPVETTGTVYRIDATDGSGDYFLLENRQRLGYDQALYQEGLLIWHIDVSWVAAQWGRNRVNAYARRGVWLRQADGRDQLGTPNSGRGDPGDPFPWVQGGNTNVDFHAGSSPASRSLNGTPLGVTLTGITRTGDQVQLSASTRRSRVTLSATGADGGQDLFTINGSSVSGVPWVLESAPFVDHEIAAAPGDETSSGVRVPFLQWADDATAPASRTFTAPRQDSDLIAEYGGRQVELAIAVVGGTDGISPGTFATQPSGPDLWFADGTSVVVEAMPTPGFGFTSWSGALAGQGNPAMITMNGPVQAGAVFEQTFALSATSLSFPAAALQNLTLAVSDGTAPTIWTQTGGTLPPGIILEPDGRLTGAALESGTFDLGLRVTDGRGLRAEGSLSLSVSAPEIGVASLTQLFVGAGEPLTQQQRDFLDRQGNGNGNYDLGDLRAWVLANPSLPFSADLSGLVGTIRRTPAGGGR